MSEAYIFPFAVVVVVWLGWLTVRPRKHRIPQTLRDDVAANKSDCDELHQRAVALADRWVTQAEQIDGLRSALDELHRSAIYQANKLGDHEGQIEELRASLETRVGEYLKNSGAWNDLKYGIDKLEREFNAYREKLPNTSLRIQAEQIRHLTAALDGLLAHEQRKARKVKAKPKRRK